jgi:nitrite reductase/ring-hydroxylating ferredoxin subunit
MSEYKLKNVTSLSLQPGEKQEVEVEGIDDAKVLLVNAAGKIQAIGPKCTHFGAPLVKGVLTKSGRITCPWHGGKSLRPSRTCRALAIRSQLFRSW